MDEYPEHEKLAAVKDESQAIGEFLDVGPWTLCRLVPEDEEMHAHFTPMDIQTALAEYYEIDLNALEREKRAMLDAIRSAAR